MVLRNLALILALLILVLSAVFLFAVQSNETAQTAMIGGLSLTVLIAVWPWPERDG